MPVGVESPGKRHCVNSQRLERTIAQKQEAALKLYSRFYNSGTYRQKLRDADK